MVYKLGNIRDMSILPKIDSAVSDIIKTHARVLNDVYGADRDVDRDDGGYVLYAARGTAPSDIKRFFDYSVAQIESVSLIKAEQPVFVALYLLNNEFAVTLIVSASDAPPEIVKEYERGK